MASFSSSGAPAPDELVAWRQSIARKQSAVKTPDELARAKAMSERQLRLASHAKKGARLKKCSQMSRAAVAGSMLSFSSSAAPPTPAPAPPAFAGGLGMFRRAPSAPAAAAAPTPVASARAMSLFGASAAPGQTKAQAVGRAEAAKSALDSLRRAAEDDDDDAGELMLERAQQQLLSAGYEWAADDAALDAVDAELSAGGETAAAEGGGAQAALLGQLKTEPVGDDAETAAKFGLYEAHAEAVATVRAALFELWRDARDDFDGCGARDARAAVERQLAAIDAHGNLELREDRRYWFVFSMATAVSANEAKIARVMREVQAKLELLAAQADCPICLEPPALPAATTLGCAHRVCDECWRHWSATCRAVHKTPYCPLCRQDEFIGDVMTGM